LFVGSHDEAEKWLETNRGLRWQQKAVGKPQFDVVSRLEREKEKLQAELKKRETDQHELIGQLDTLVLSNDELEGKLRSRQKELDRLSAQVRELESRQERIEAERQQALRQREQLADLQSQLLDERERLQFALQRSNKERARLSSQVSQLERENRRLRQQIETQAGRVLTNPSRRHWRWAAFTLLAGGLCLFVVLMVNGLAASRDDKVHSGQPVVDIQLPKQPEAKQPAARSPALTPEQATGRVGQVCTVEFVVRSARASREGKLVFLNSESNYQHASNFTVMLGGEVLSRATEPAGVVAQSWVGKTVRVRGEVREYKGRCEIKVDSMDQLDPP
jgi:outer membrane murein-binding lipoprotein Lpp/ribosomal protein L39E